MLNDEAKMLKRVPLFAGLSPAKLKLLAFTSERVMYRAGEVLFHQGDPGDAAYVILSGRAAILADTEKGPIQVAEVDDNAIVGEIAILCGATRSASVQATTAVEALRIGKDEFLKLLTDFPEMTVEVVRVLAERLTRTTAELTEARSRIRAAGVPV